MVDEMISPLQPIPLFRQITEADNLLPIIDVIHKEIHEVIKQFRPLKAPSPDGIQVVFYQKS